MPSVAAESSFPAFDRQFLSSDRDFTVIGTGALGGKALGLAFIKRIIAEQCPPGLVPGLNIRIPRLTVVQTDAFEQFMARNRLWDVVRAEPPDDRLAHAFQRADLPPLILGDLRAIVQEMHSPLAIRSSSLLEDALRHPFAGTYATKMIANNQPDTDHRFQRLAEAIKYVWASTFFQDARSYLRAIGRTCEDERMAVIIQEVVGRRHGDRFYPAISGVIRTYNFYPQPPARPEEGVVSLALGLGKTIVDGGVVWTYSPAHPTLSPPYGSTRELLEHTQTEFWAVNMGPPPAYDPINEAEYLISGTLADAEADGTLRPLASTYDAESDRLVIGLGRHGPRALTFAPVLELNAIPLNPGIRHLMTVCRAALSSDVEIEFAVTFDPRGSGPAEFGFLQLRPTLVSGERVAVPDHELADPAALVTSDRVLGNGARDDLTDIVYVRPDTFAPQHTRAVAAELEGLSRALVEAGRHCILIGFGRWGSSDPWLGIPVTWPQIAAARVIVEATRPDMHVTPSQGSHFFHNMTGFGVLYFTVHHAGPGRIHWDALAALPPVREGPFVRHVRAPTPLTVRVDGRTGRGIIAPGGR